MSAARRRNNRTLDAEVEEEQRARAEVESNVLLPTVPSTFLQPAVVVRSKLGWQIRLDLKKACQQIALDENRKDYEVLEMLLDEALAARSTKVEK